MSKTMKIILSIIALVIIILLVRGVAMKKSTTSNEVIKIGAALGLTGESAEWGEVSKNGAMLAIDEINSKGGIHGKKLELVIEDTRSTSKDTLSAVTKLQSIDKTKAMLVTWLDIYQGSESIINPDSFIISPDSGVEAINGEKTHPRIFSTWYRTQPKSELAIKHMSEHGVKTLYLLGENDSYYTTALTFMKEAADKYGITIVGVEQPTSADALKTIFVKIKEKNPDAVFFAFYDEQKSYEFLAKYKSFTKQNVKVYGDELIRQNYASDKYPKGTFEGIYFYSPMNPDNTFTEKYRARFNTEPVFGASTSYDAIYMIAKALEKNPTDVDTFFKNNSFDTVSYGKTTFDELGGVSPKQDYFEMKQIINGKISE